MKKHFTVKLTSLLLCVVMLFSVIACTSENTTATTSTTAQSSVVTNNEPSLPDGDDPVYPANGEEKIVSKAVMVYESADEVRDVVAAHYETCPEILLMDIVTLCDEFLNKMPNHTASFVYEEDDTTVTITRSNGAYCIIDFVKDTMYFNDFDLFTAYGHGNMADLLEFEYVDEEGNSVYFERTGSTTVLGLPVIINLANRNIPLDIYEGEKYVPFQTFNDVFLSPFYCNFVYNSKDLFFSEGGGIASSLVNEYYSIEPAERSEALVEYTTSELCLLLDLFYGLKDEHGVLNGFEAYLKQAGLWEKLNSPDASESNAALASLIYKYLADKHSSFNLASPYTGSLDLKDPVDADPDFLRFFDLMGKMNAVRNEIMPNGVKGYLEIGNTAYITLDSFVIAEERSKTSYENAREIDDTIGLIIYAHSMITRENSPIENVVLDLSCNTGGMVDAAYYVVGWMLGYCDVHEVSPITKGYATASYKVDVNLDGVFDENDTIADKNLYCLISPLSFSCGNLVPSLLNESDRVTFLGGTTGGGACAVQFASLADGSLFQISGPHYGAVISNGAYYPIENGVEPHYHFSKLESYFEREALTEYINNLK